MWEQEQPNVARHIVPQVAPQFNIFCLHFPGVFSLVSPSTCASSRPDIHLPSNPGVETVSARPVSSLHQSNPMQQLCFYPKKPHFHIVITSHDLTRGHTKAPPPRARPTSVSSTNLFMHFFYFILFILNSCSGLSSYFTVNIAIS